EIEIFDSIEAISQQKKPEVIAIDVPIGLEEGEPRKADTEARKLIGGRSSSVFPTPPSFCLDPKWSDYREANQESRRRYQRGINIQSFALMKYIREADAVSHADSRIYETHPEVCFSCLKSSPLEYSKKTWNGQQERIELLKHAGIILPTYLDEEKGKIPPDDLLDAAVAAWSANRIALGTAQALPNAEQRRNRIWF
ncbi:DUF429 domain-containing protein, partial [Verrucomicrobiales bacterium]|nr:DUF429 domain-containing protein [Verrucomicrobiales bacterium]